MSISRRSQDGEILENNVARRLVREHDIEFCGGKQATRVVRRRRWIGAVLGGALAALSTVWVHSAVAADFSDPTWPCVQRKVVRLSIGQMWTGEILSDDIDWRADPKVASLAPVLSARRTTLEEAQPLVDDFAQDADNYPSRVAVHRRVPTGRRRARARLVDGIGKYSLRQDRLSKSIDALRDEIFAKRQSTADDDFDALDALDVMDDDLTWKTRIYDERRQSLIYVCESPVIMEKRAFAIARMIAAHLK